MLARLLTERQARIVVPIIFGLTLVLMIELIVTGLKVPFVILPKPSEMVARLFGSLPMLWADFAQTILKGALTGYIMGCAAALSVAFLASRSDFLRRGLLPLGNFVAALPVVGLAPIMVMWFGFGWESKAAIVVSMCFFPMLVNSVQGLAATSAIERDLFKTYAATPVQQLNLLRLPAAMPFILNGLKVCTPLALIGAIVAEFFGSPSFGMGFRIKTSVGSLSLDLVWAEIIVAALAGTGFFGLLLIVERSLTFWHPSQRR
ncbi:MAG: ABC transporter permease [Pseudomonadota bacterium]|nr:ABC transporter permease [Pseudomonadota bacterium]MEC8274398.1 ABC transporter permease [Pseudomonadota bacterium]